MPSERAGVDGASAGQPVLASGVEVFLRRVETARAMIGAAEAIRDDRSQEGTPNRLMDRFDQQVKVNTVMMFCGWCADS